MNCPKCNYPAAPNQKFCENCGAPIAQVQIDVERTMAADVDDIPAVPQQPEQSARQSPVPQQAEPQVQPIPQEAEPQVQPIPQQAEPQVQSDPQAAEPQVQPIPQEAEPQVQPAPQEAEPQVQPAPQQAEPQVQSAQQSDAPEWPEGGSVASAWQTPAKDYSQMYQEYNKPSQFSNGQNNSYGYSVPGGQSSGYGYSVPGGTVKTVNKKKVAIIVASAVVAVGLIVALIIIIASCAVGSHSIKNADGVEIASDSSIHPNDSDAEQKINAMLQNNGLTGTNTGISYMQYYAKGNAAVQEEKLLSKASDQEKSTYRATMESQLNGAEAKLPSYRAASGVDDMVCVYVLLDADNSIIYQKVIK